MDRTKSLQQRRSRPRTFTPPLHHYPPDAPALPNSPYHSHAPQKLAPSSGTTTELKALIDAHIAWQDDNNEDETRPSSRGTLLVDWDGSGTPVVSYGRAPVAVIQECYEEEEEEELVQTLVPSPLRSVASASVPSSPLRSVASGVVPSSPGMMMMMIERPNTQKAWPLLPEQRDLVGVEGQWERERECRAWCEQWCASMVPAGEAAAESYVPVSPCSLQSGPYFDRYPARDEYHAARAEDWIEKKTRRKEKKKHARKGPRRSERKNKMESNIFYIKHTSTHSSRRKKETCGLLGALNKEWKKMLKMFF